MAANAAIDTNNLCRREALLGLLDRRPRIESVV